eukprot:GHVU01108630.1.p1 GENE.GHVU01108630.1~~GHVU01108630.1.p1  ORF type:complete len:102 (+),score=12.04 GHVU01108630.1:29-307(+)
MAVRTIDQSRAPQILLLLQQQQQQQHWDLYVTSIYIAGALAASCLKQQHSTSNAVCTLFERCAHAHAFMSARSSRPGERQSGRRQRVNIVVR